MEVVMKALYVAGMLAVCVTAWAQTAPKPAAEDNPNSVKLTKGPTVASAVAAMAKTVNARVIVDPAVTGSVPASMSELPLEQGLTAIASSKHATWRKVYLKDSDIPKKADGTIEVGKLKQMVELASLAPETSIGVVDPKDGRVITTNRTSVSSPSTQAWLKDRTALYVLYQPSVVGGGVPGTDPVTDYLAVQRNSYAAFGKMTPEQRAQAMQQGMEEVINMDPQVMAQMARESMQALQNLSPEAKAKLMDISMAMMSGAQGAPPPPPPPPGQ